MIRELIEKAKTADKPGLIQILDELGIKADQRKGEETLRAETLAGLEQALADETDALGSGSAEPAGQGIQEAELVPADAAELQPSAPAEPVPVLESAATVMEAPAAGLSVPDFVEQADPSLTPPNFDDEQAPAAPIDTRPVNRLLRNTSTGAEFVWTPELAKLAHMEEV